MADGRVAPLPAGAFQRLDDGDDTAFYAPARLVTHIDDAAVRALTGHYAQLLSPCAVVLDLMSSWVSHLPPDPPLAEVIGHGMNAEELASNPRLTSSFIQDLNRDPRLPLADDSLDAAFCCVGVQYLQRPVEVFAEVARASKPGAPFAVSFSNRCFPTKAVAIWRALDTGGHARLVQSYLARAGYADPRVQVLSDGSRGDPLVVVTGRA